MKNKSNFCSVCGTDITLTKCPSVIYYELLCGDCYLWSFKIASKVSYGVNIGQHISVITTLLAEELTKVKVTCKDASESHVGKKILDLCDVINKNLAKN